VIRRTLVVLAAGGLALFLLLPARMPPIGACPDGTRLAGAPPPRATQQWCERTAPDGRPVKEGPYAAWHANGRRKIDGVYRNGLMTGRWTFWYPSGRKREEGELQDGREQGVWTRWYADGGIEDQGVYRDGLRQGRWRSWYDNGHQAREGAYDRGVPVGRWARWTVKGEACDVGPS
jgi:hypothetical protein